MQTDTQPLAEIRCSLLPLIAKCGGVIRGDLAIDDAGDAAATGTAAHDVLESIIRAGEPLTVPDLTDYIDRHRLNEEQAADLRFLAWAGLGLWKEIAGFFPSPALEVFRAADFHGVRLTGHSDVSCIAGRRAAVLDWKSGRKTDSDYSDQLKGYGWLVCADHPEVQEVSLSVAWLRTGEIETWTYSRAELDQWARSMARNVARWDGRYRTGEHCRLCPRRWGCDARRAMVQGAVDELVDGSAVAALSADGFAALSPADRGDVLAAMLGRLAVLDKLVTDAREVVKQYVAAAGSVPTGDGREVRLVQSERDTLDSEKTLRLLAGRMDLGDMAACCRVSKTAVLSWAGAGAARGGKGAAKAALLAELEAAGAVVKSETESVKVLPAASPVAVLA